jgi:hypothetical protein
MISKEAADAIARVLLEQAGRESALRKNAIARRGLVFYRFSELGQFELWQRDVITRRCASLVNREPVTVALYGIWLSFVLAVAFFHPSPVFGVRVGGLVVLGGLLLVAFHRWRVRQYVRAFLDFVQSREGPHSNAG